MPLLCQHNWRVWWLTLCGGGLCVAADDTSVSTLLTCVVVDSVWRQMTLLCQHHYCVWTVNGGSWHYCVNITDVCGGGLCVAADDTIVSTPLLYMNCNSHQFSLGFFVGSCYLIFCFLCSYLYIILYPFVPFNFTIVLYVLFPITVSIYPFGICKTVLPPY